jgi:hypothetical protein
VGGEREERRKSSELEVSVRMSGGRREV